MTPKVLIVEDNHFLSKLFRIAFSRHDCETQEAFDGEQGWKKFRPFHPDIIVLDIVIPKMHGISLLKKIRKASPDIFVAIVTNLDKEMLKQHAEILQDTPYFKKSEMDPREITKQILDMYKQS